MKRGVRGFHLHLSASGRKKDSGFSSPSNESTLARPPDPLSLPFPHPNSIHSAICCPLRAFRRARVDARCGRGRSGIERGQQLRRITESEQTHSPDPSMTLTFTCIVLHTHLHHAGRRQGARAGRGSQRGPPSHNPIPSPVHHDAWEPAGDRPAAGGEPGGARA